MQKEDSTLPESITLEDGWASKHTNNPFWYVRTPEMAQHSLFPDDNTPTGAVSTSKQISIDVYPCASCGRIDAKMRCTECKLLYCNRICQKNDWERHKKLCKHIKEMSSV